MQIGLDSFILYFSSRKDLADHCIVKFKQIHCSLPLERSKTVVIQSVKIIPVATVICKDRKPIFVNESCLFPEKLTAGNIRM